MNIILLYFIVDDDARIYEYEQEIYSILTIPARATVLLSIVAAYSFYGARAAWITAATCGGAMAASLLATNAIAKSFKPMYVSHLVLPVLIGTVSSGVACGRVWRSGGFMIPLAGSVIFAVGIHFVLASRDGQAGKRIKELLGQDQAKNTPVSSSAEHSLSAAHSSAN